MITSGITREWTIQRSRSMPGTQVKSPLQPEGQFPADLSLLPPADVHRWQVYWYGMMASTIEPDKKHIYTHNWKRCCKYLEQLADRKLEAEFNMEQHS